MGARRVVAARLGGALVTRVYVAGSSAEVSRAEAAIAALTAAGLTVTSVWPAIIREARAAGIATDADLDDARARHEALTCEEAVGASDVVLWLVSERPSHGAAWEASRARALGITLVAAGPHARSTIFAHRADHITPTDAAGVEHVIAWARADAAAAPLIAKLWAALPSEGGR